MDGFVSLAKSEQFKGSIFNGFPRDFANNSRDCGLVDSCSPFYRSYLRAVRWLAEQCELFYGDNQCNGVDNFIKDIMFGKISPNNEDYVVLNSHVPPNERNGAGPGIWLEEKTARLIREVQRDFDLRNDSKYFGQFTALCGRNLDEIRSQFYVDCYSECVQPQGCRMKANTTECVPVPSSEHVAEIVGKKGGKIKNIRAETNTYIKTPKRDEEPVFVITGRKEDVAFAKQKILAAAEHFSQLREARRQNPTGPAPSLGPPKREGDVTVSVEVPYEFVGLVVGQKGATIKRIQQDTNTYITTPSRRHRPIFEVVGQPCDVETAREAITAHINSRVDKFRGEGSGPGGGGGGGGSFGASSNLSFLGMEEPPSYRPPPGGEPPLFGGLGDANLGGTWTGVPPPGPPPPPKQPPPPPPPAFLSSAEPLAGLSASLRGLTLPDSTVTAATASATAGWLADGRGRTASLPAADPADTPVGRRRSDDGAAPRALGGLLFGLPPTLGWEGGPLPPARRASSKGSSETLNSDSGVETTTPPPPLDGAAFGPIGSKRTSPTSLSGCSE